jgi:ribokinase
MMRIVVVGDLVTDVVVSLHGPIAPASDTPAAIASLPGGSAGNVAAWAAAAGSDVTLVARVGRDAAGEALREELAAQGVTLAVAADAAAPTGTIVVLVDADGQRTMLTDRGANDRLAPADVEAGLAGTRSGHLHLSGYTLLDAAPRPAGRAALATARRLGWTTSVSPASEAPLRAVGAPAFLQWTAGVWLCVANLAEARVLGGAQDPVDAARRLTAHYDEVVVTCGPDGVVWCAAEAGPVVLPAPAVTAVDTTGAGDALTAGFLRARLDGAGPEAALHAGLALAARAITRPGGRAAAHGSPQEAQR